LTHASVAELHDMTTYLQRSWNPYYFTLYWLMDRQAFLESLYLKMECFICNEVIKRMVLYEAIIW